MIGFESKIIFSEQEISFQGKIIDFMEQKEKKKLSIMLLFPMIPI